jgi:hypothetical protein
VLVIDERPVDELSSSDDDPRRELPLLPEPIVDEVDNPNVFKLL